MTAPNASSSSTPYISDPAPSRLVSQGRPEFTRPRDESRVPLLRSAADHPPSHRTSPFRDPFCDWRPDAADADRAESRQVGRPLILSTVRRAHPRTHHVPRFAARTASCVVVLPRPWQTTSHLNSILLPTIPVTQCLSLV